MTQPENTTDADVILPGETFRAWRAETRGYIEALQRIESETTDINAAAIACAALQGI